MTFTNHRNAFLRIFNATARYHHRHKVFEDFVSCAAIALHNGVAHDAELEKQYLSIIASYEQEDVNQMAALLGHVVMALDEKRCDFLGSVFMELELGDKYRGQFFTPWDVSRMMASLQLSGIDALMQGKNFITLQEPASGAGCMVIAFAEEFAQRGYTVSEQLWVSVTDVDPLAANMSYIQLSLCGIAAEVVTGNALTLERRRTLYTPLHYTARWAAKLSSAEQRAA
ncbi:N-6 DNA methylase [Pantoea anthophila]|uniref:SAM-dependent DNA methyltransferase n=1 Tax=Pantoea anthophila TaxID=470931 RepID=A0ABY2Z4Y5_9GAMM|nr:N-6 DNA methylase [Pantoea anthophila]TPV23719.1 SAM-dependent DNA methyltransferase [Pantoea anthophila]